MADGLVFLFPGQGSQYPRMGEELWRAYPDFRDDLVALDDRLAARRGHGVLTRLYDRSTPPGRPFDDLRDTHPAIFMVQYATARLLIRRGVRPDHVLGASLGEVAAATIAGALDAETALDLVCGHAERVIHSCPPGGMMAVLAPPQLTATEPLLRDRCELVSVNGPEYFVVAGAPDTLDELARLLDARRIAHQRLPVGYAFHSAYVEAARPEFDGLSEVGTGRPLRLPMVSCATGGPLTALPPGHWWRVLREPIRAVDALRAVASVGSHRYVEIGPGTPLTATLRQNSVASRSSHTVLTPFHAEPRTLAELCHLVGSPAPAARRSGPAGQTREDQPMLAYVFPGQGAQRKGMGADLFDEFPELVAQADEVLGWSVRETCLEDPHGRLDRTEYTQPALYVVNALSYLRQLARTGREPDFLAGHSLGEYDALFAARVFDFATGLTLVRRRGELMCAATGGGMAVVIGLPADDVSALLARDGRDTVVLANLNTPSQVVLSGPRADVLACRDLLTTAGARFVPLNVSGAFHSRYMRDAQREFGAFLAGFTLPAPSIPVISNVTARPYGADVADLLVRQIASSVNWTDTVRYLLARGVTVEQVGPGAVLTGLTRAIQREAAPLVLDDLADPVPSARASAAPSGRTSARPVVTPPVVVPAAVTPPVVTPAAVIPPVVAPVAAAPAPARTRAIGEASAPTGGTVLGNDEFRAAYGLRHAYASGSMYRGIASKELVERLARAGMLAFVGTGGMRRPDVVDAIEYLRRRLPAGTAYGFNLLHSHGDPEREEEQIDLFLAHGVELVEASAFIDVSPALVRYRLAGLRRGPDGRVRAGNRIMAKVSRPEVATAFLSPAPRRVVEALLAAGGVTPEQAALAAELPMADDLTVEADSGGHTDGGVAYALMPAMLRLRDDLRRQHGYHDRVRIGAAGGIGTPEAAAAALVLGADYLVTGSINQCTVESGASDPVKALLQDINVQDTDYAPAGDMFELGSRVQVLRRGVFFPARANKLYSLYRQYDSLEDIDARTRQQLEQRYFKRTFDEVWELVRQHKSADEVTRAAANPKQRMLLVFKWYFAYSNQLALDGDEENTVDFQVHCGPALGAFNQWVKGTPLQDWRARHVDDIGHRLMAGTAELLDRRMRDLVRPAARPPQELAPALT
uniref:[acyl-carrier-protein] S-malonyltransferase n=1 Tax=Micromonospora carbonacea TaxID=47853 RepID=A0A7D6GG63_9ACTN|nr:ACP S-malonyltransferase [Micromonospora carbonacea]